MPKNAEKGGGSLTYLMIDKRNKQAKYAGIAAAPGSAKDVYFVQHIGK
jgi:hypothetical protein